MSSTHMPFDDDDPMQDHLSHAGQHAGHPEAGFEVGDDIEPVWSTSASEPVDEAAAPVKGKKAAKGKPFVIPPQAKKIGMMMAVLLALAVGFLIWQKKHRKTEFVSPVAVEQPITPMPSPLGDVANGQPVQIPPTTVVAAPPAAAAVAPPVVEVPAQTAVAATVVPEVPSTPAAVPVAAAPAAAVVVAPVATTPVPTSPAIATAAPVAVASADDVVVMKNRLNDMDSKLRELEGQLASERAHPRTVEKTHVASAVHVTHVKVRAKPDVLERNPDVVARAMQQVQTMPVATPVATVIGGTQRAGVVAVLMNVNGVKRIVQPGDDVAGLGRVDATGLDGDSAFVRIGSTTYR